MARSLIAGLLLVCLVPTARGEEASTRPIELSEGELVVTAPIAWESVQPANRIIEHELAVAPPEGSDAPAARLTIMAAGGSVDANLSRWVGQFQGTEGGADRGEAKTEKLDANGMAVTLLDASGTYLESLRGPFGPKTPRDNYRLVGAVVETDGAGNYFFKLIGPEATVEPAVEAFREMVLSLRKTK